MQLFQTKMASAKWKALEKEAKKVNLIQFILLAYIFPHHNHHFRKKIKTIRIIWL